MKGITEHKIQRVITFRELLSRRLEADAAINYMHCSKGRNQEVCVNKCIRRNLRSRAELV